MGIYIALMVVTLLLAMFIKQTTPQPYAENSLQSGRKTRQQILNRVCIFGIFSLLFAVSALRTGIGNDYYKYRIYFQNIYKGFEHTLEPGFSWFVIFMQKVFGYDQYRIIFAAFAFATIFFFLKGIYQQSDWFVFSFFLFMAIGCYLNSYSTVRYYFALSLALYSMKYVLKKDYPRFIFWIILGALFHKSVLFVIPVYYIAALNWKRWFYIGLGILSAALLFLPEVFRILIFTFYPFYEKSVYDTSEISYTNIARSLGTLLLALIYYKKAVSGNHKMEFYFHLNILATIIYCFCSFIPVVSRIGYYCNIVQIFLIPGVIMKIPDKKQKYFFGICVVLAFILYFLLFLKKAQGIDIRIVPYRTWLFE